MASAFPPHRSIESIPIPQSTALAYLQKYLEATTTTPYLLPNARLEPNGPTADNSSSLTMHNLRRVEAGLRGEWLAPVLDLEEGVEVATGEQDEGGADKMQTEGWQDLEEYQREQSVQEGEVVPDEKAIGQEGDGAIENGTLKTSSKSKTAGKVDKKARKEEKKARLKAQQRQKAEQRKAAAE